MLEGTVGFAIISQTIEVSVLIMIVMNERCPFGIRPSGKYMFTGHIQGTYSGQYKNNHVINLIIYLHLHLHHRYCPNFNRLKIVDRMWCVLSARVWINSACVRIKTGWVGLQLQAGQPSCEWGQGWGLGNVRGVGLGYSILVLFMESTSYGGNAPVPLCRICSRTWTNVKSLKFAPIPVGGSTNQKFFIWTRFFLEIIVR